MIKVSLLNGVAGVGSMDSVGSWVEGVKFWRGWHGSIKFRRGFIKTWRWSKKGVGGVGLNFGVVGVGLRCFVEKALLKVSQTLQKSTSAGVSC